MFWHCGSYALPDMPVDVVVIALFLAILDIATPVYLLKPRIPIAPPGLRNGF